MKIGLIPENLFERLALAAGSVPTPLAESWFTFFLARTIMVATKLDVFEAVADTSLDATEVAKRCGTDSRATVKLLNALVGVGLMRTKEERYALTPPARKWLLQNSAESVRDKILFQAGTWSAEEMRRWQSDAGLIPRQTMHLRIARDVAVQAAVKPM